MTIENARMKTTEKVIASQPSQAMGLDRVSWTCAFSTSSM